MYSNNAPITRTFLPLPLPNVPLSSSSPAYGRAHGVGVLADVVELVGAPVARALDSLALRRRRRCQPQLNIVGVDGLSLRPTRQNTGTAGSDGKSNQNENAKR